MSHYITRSPTEIIPCNDSCDGRHENRPTSEANKKNGDVPATSPAIPPRWNAYVHGPRSVVATVGTTTAVAVATDRLSVLCPCRCRSPSSQHRNIAREDYVAGPPLQPSTTRMPLTGGRIATRWWGSASPSANDCYRN